MLKLIIECLQEIAALRQGILTCEGELRAVSSPAYTAKDRDRALAEQSVSTVSGALPSPNIAQKSRGGEQQRCCRMDGVGGHSIPPSPLTSVADP